MIGLDEFIYQSLALFWVFFLIVVSGCTGCLVMIKVMDFLDRKGIL